MQRITNKPLFDLGRLVATAGALAALEKTGQNAVEFLARHVTGDWGELPVEDRTENYLSLKRGFRLLSSYRTSAGETTLLTALGKFIPPDERILLIEDTAEIQLHQENLVRFEARREQNGTTAVSIRDLLKTAPSAGPNSVGRNPVRRSI